MERLAAVIWGTPTMLLLLVTGCVMSLQTRFVQVRKLGTALRQMCGSLRGNNRSSFQALCTALAGTVGTGNIAGVASAIALGGPGAVFWMWVSGFLGMATKYAEVVLAIRYRRTTSDGKRLGGPMYYMLDGLGSRWKPIASVFACCTVMASLGMGNMVQVNTMVGAVQRILPTLQPAAAAVWTGAAAICVTMWSTAGGRSGRILEKLVPLMAALYICGTAAVLIRHGNRLGAVLEMIVVGAFSPSAVLGAGAGIGIRRTIRWGIARGLFSNEAGLGSAPIAHAAAEVPAEQQGLFGVLEVFLDTIVLCTLTALTILVSGVPVRYGETAGVEIVIAALKTVFGAGATALMAVCLVLLAMATLIGWQVYGLQCAKYLWGEQGDGIYRRCYAVAIMLGALLDCSAIWAFSDVCNGLMCLPNLAALLLLRRQVTQAPCKTG